MTYIMACTITPYTTVWYAIHMPAPSQTHLWEQLVLAEEGWGMWGWVAQ